MIHFADRSKAVLFCGSFLLFMFHVCLYYAVLSVLCSHLITCLERADFLLTLYVMFLVFLSLSYECLRLGVVLDLSSPDLCNLFYFR